MDEGKIDHRVDLAKQVILLHQAVERDHLERGLFGSRFLQHVPMNHNPLAVARGLSEVWNMRAALTTGVSVPAIAREFGTSRQATTRVRD